MKKRKSHITLPRSYDPGPGYPRETLAYLSEAEHELIRKLTDGKWNRGPKGVRSYADDSASSKGVSRGDNSGTKGSGGLGQGGQGSGGSAGSKSGGSSSASSSSSSSASKSSSSGSSSSSSSSSSGAGRDSSRGIGQGAGGSAIGRGGASTATGKAAEAAKANAANVAANSPNTVGPNRNWGNVLNTPYNTVFPERAPVTGTATSFPGRPRSGKNALGVSRVHAGLDIATPVGAPVTPAVPGKVVQVAYSPGAYGPTVQVMNTFGVIDRYALHKPQDIPVKVGQSVYPGTVLGVAGKVKNIPSNFSHLHYERITPADPAFGTIKRGMMDGSLAKARGGVVGSTSSYSRQTGANVPDEALNSSTRSWAKSMGISQGENLQRGASLRGPMDVSPISSPSTGLAGVANAGLAQAAAEARARKATAGLDAIQKAATPPSAFASDPRLGVPQGALPAAPLRSTAGTYTTPYNPEVQGPLRYGGPLDKIPTPNSTGYATLMTPAFAADPRLSVPQGSYPAAPPKSAFASDPRLSVPQGSYPAAKPPSAFAADPRLSIPQGAYPAAKPPSAFAADPRLGVPQGAYPARAQTTVAGDPRLSQTPVGAFPAARPSSQVYTDPRVSQTPPGAFPAAQRPASVFAEDPRVATTPLGSLPAAKPKEIQLAWNVPPMGGALPGQAAWGLGLWGTNRPLPTGPGAQPGTIHSQTADATSAPPASEDKPSFWQQAGDLYNTASTAAKEKVEEIKQDPGFKFAQKYPRLAEFALKMMMGGGGTPNPNGFGNPQDRSGYVTRPQPPQVPQMAQAQGGVSTDPLTILTNLQANMIAQGASPEELAYVQSIIDELTNSQVA